jgi:hypothetical protein
VLAGLGLAGLATGVVLNLKVNRMSSDLEADWRFGDESTRQGYKTAGWIAYGGGAGCLTAGTILYYFGWRRGQEPTHVALFPMASPQIAGAALSGAF